MQKLFYILVYKVLLSVLIDRGIFKAEHKSTFDLGSMPSAFYISRQSKTAICLACADCGFAISKNRRTVLMTKRLETISGEELMNTPLEETRMIVQGLIPQGLHILGSAPKFGKSWLVLRMCVRIAMDENVWDFKTEKGTALYLCLEDSKCRIQNRLFYITDNAPGNVHFAPMADTIGGGLIKQIELFIPDYPDTNFIAIDTLQRVRNPSGDINAYANDYKNINILKGIADKHKIAILLVHHLRKQGDDDPMNML